MKVIKITSKLLFAVTLLVFACKKDDPENPRPPKQSVYNYQGDIVLSGNSPIDPNTLTIQSNSDSSSVSNGGFNLQSSSNYTSLYATNPQGEVVLMSYTYPGSTSNNLSSTSTALGLIMMSPMAISLSESGKSNLINTVLNDPNFGTLVSEVELNLNSGGNLFDTSNTALLNAIRMLYQSASQKTSSITSGNPISLSNNGRSFTFSNDRKPYSTVIGIYKDSVQIAMKTVDGVPFLPGSISQLLASIGSPSNNPSLEYYTLQDDGDYTFKIRTGKPGFGDGSVEHSEAFYENIVSFAYSLTLTIAPQLGNFLNSCGASVTANTLNTIQNLISVNGQQNIGSILYIGTDIFVANLHSLLQGCATQGASNLGWFSSFMAQWNMLNIAFSTISNAANTTHFAYQWANSNHIVDTCFTVQGNDVNGGYCFPSFTDPRDGQVYRIVTIGNQTWFAENLNYAIGNSWCYGNNTSNCNTYGRLYDWQTALTACPSGWHLPTKAEWTILTDYLGGYNVAGGKMKSTTGWFAPNTGATNSSGFSGLPGGFRYGYTGSFYNIDIFGYWWSSTEDNSPYKAWARYMSHTHGGIGASDYDKTEGFSCRCLRD